MRFRPDPLRAPHLRCADADREQVADFLRERCAEGRLGVDELSERLERVYGARTYGELDPVMADLPRPVAAAPAPRSGSRAVLITLAVVATIVVGLQAIPLILIPVLAIVAGITVGIVSLAAPVLAIVGGAVWLARRVLPAPARPPLHLP